MSGDVIKSFLVGLGFDVDESSLAKFNKSIALATVKVTALSASIIATATAVGKGITSISSDFEELGYQYRIITPAINKAIVLRRELFKAYSSAGIDIQKTVLASLRLNMSITKTKYALDAIYKSVGSKFFGILTKQSDLFRQKIYANMPKIQATLESLVHFIFKALDAVTALGLRLWSILTRVFDFFVKLDKATDGWSTVILGVVAAWKLLNLSFLATPLGMIIAGLAAILVLFDDFETWKEGGASLFDWTKFIPIIDATAAALTAVYNVLKSIGKVLGDVAAAIYLLFQGNFQGAWNAVKQAAVDALGYFHNLYLEIQSIWSLLKTIGSWVIDVGGGVITRLTSGSNDSLINKITGNLANSPNGVPPAAPLGVGNTQNSSQTNVNANLQTSVHVSGVPDANGVGKVVTGEQGKNIFDLIRNMQGAVKPGGILK